MSAVSGASKQVIIPPSNEEPVVNQKQEDKPQASVPNRERIRHEIIMAKILLTCRLNDQGKMEEDPSKRDVTINNISDALEFLRGNEGFKRLLDKI